MRPVIEVVIGLLLGLGLLIVSSGMFRSGLLSKLARHLPERGAARENDSSKGMVEAIFAIFQTTPASLTEKLFPRGMGSRAVSDELPGVVDLFGLCITAGMSAPEAFSRVASAGTGVLPGECVRIVAELNLNKTLSAAAKASAERVGHEGWSRFIEHVLTSRKNGTPLAEILRSRATEERAAAGRRLLESASARETAMLFPLVFLILPATVLIAVFPGIGALGSFSFG